MTHLIKHMLIASNLNVLINIHGASINNGQPHMCKNKILIKILNAYENVDRHICSHLRR